jgi:hypothetical protein
MKKIVILICITIHLQIQAQNVGIKTTTPQSALDINGDFTLRKATLTLPAGASNNVDISTNKYSVYDFAGGALAGGAQIYGFAGGTDGRMVTVFNNSTTSAMQIMDESHPGSASSLAANRIVTGSGNGAVIYQNGSVTLRYDAQKQRWTIIGSNYTDGLSASPSSSVWSISGTNILNNNTGNVGIGELTPIEKLHINNGNLKLGKNIWNTIADDRFLKFGDGDYVSIGETGGDDQMELRAGNINLKAGTIQVPTGLVGINTTTPMLNRLQIGNTVSPFAGNDICIGNGTQTMSISQTTEAAIWFSNNNFAFMPVSTGNGNVGIGTTNPTYKLSVNGNIRAKEVVIETGWADYVFEKNYRLRPLSEVEQFIKKNNHLPNIPSAEDIQKNGLNVAAVQTKMMEKIEELTLYVIELKKEIELLKTNK